MHRDALERVTSRTNAMSFAPGCGGHEHSNRSSPPGRSPEWLPMTDERRVQKAPRDIMYL